MLEVLLDPLSEEPLELALTVTNPCGVDQTPSPPVVTPCGICLSRGAPRLLPGTTGSARGPANVSTRDCGPLSAHTRWYKIIPSDETGMVTIGSTGNSRGDASGGLQRFRQDPRFAEQRGLRPQFHRKSECDVHRESGHGVLDRAGSRGRTPTLTVWPSVLNRASGATS